MPEYTDSELVELCLKENAPHYLGELFTRHCDIIYRTALRVMRNTSDAEDIMQMVYCKVAEDLHHYKGTGSVLGWVLQVVVHTCLNKKKSEKSRLNRERKIMSERIATIKPQDSELIETIENHLNKLPDKYKLPITMQILEGLSIKEVSEVLAIPEKTIRSQIARGLERLKASLQSVGVTASVISVSDMLGKIQHPVTPEIFKSSQYFNSILPKTASLSGKIAIASSTKSLSLLKICAFLIPTFLASYFTWTYFNKTQNNLLQIETSKIAVSNDKNKLKKEWDFEDTTNLVQYQDIGLLKGGISLADKVGLKSSRGLLIEQDSLIEIDISKYQLPVKLTYSFRFNLPSNSKVGNGLLELKGNYKDKENIYYFNSQKSILNSDLKTNESENKTLNDIWHEKTIYISNEYVDEWINNKRSHIIWGTSADNAKILFIATSHLILDNILISSIDKSALPEAQAFENWIKKNNNITPRLEAYPLNKETTGISFGKIENQAVSVYGKQNLEGFQELPILPTIGKLGIVEWKIKRQKITKRWGFEDIKDLNEFKIIRGNVEYCKSIGIKNSNCFVIAPESVMEIDISRFQYPIKISYSHACLGKDKDKNGGGSGPIIFKGNYQNEKNIFHFNMLNSDNKEFQSEKEPVKASNEYDVWWGETDYISDDCVDMWQNGHRVSLIYGISNDNKKVYLYSPRNQAIDNFVIESIELNEIPDHHQFKEFASSMPFKVGLKDYHSLENEKPPLNLRKGLNAILAYIDKSSLERSLGIRKNH